MSGSVDSWVEDGVVTWAYEAPTAWFLVEKLKMDELVYTRAWNESDGVEFYQGKSDGGNPGFAEMRTMLVEVRGIELVYMGSRRWLAIPVEPVAS